MNKDLIEKIATDAVEGVGGIPEPGFSTYDAAVRAIEATLAVFEAAQKPTDDERVYAYREGYDSGFRDGERGEWRGDSRRPAPPEQTIGCNICGEALPDGEPHLCSDPQTEPTDAQVAAALETYWGYPDGYSRSQFEKMRAALRAAAETTNREIRYEGE